MPRDYKRALQQVKEEEEAEVLSRFHTDFNAAIRVLSLDKILTYFEDLCFGFVLPDKS